MKLRLISFTDRGEHLARRLALALNGTADRGISVSVWVKQYFYTCDALIFVGAAGIAVRSIAPYLKDKAADPAVVVVEERGRYAIPILGGHLGGANDLARKISEVCGAAAVITTATDTEGLFAVDEWAKKQNCAIAETEGIVAVSSHILQGKTVTVTSDWPIAGECPQGVATGENGMVHLSLITDNKAVLHLVPRIGVLGVGCRQKTSQAVIRQVFERFLIRNRLSRLCISRVCSIDRKAGEPGLISFCLSHNWPFQTFSAGELAEVSGEFSSSSFVAETVGVDNVCERAAVLGSGGILIAQKFAENGVTMALAAEPYMPDWRWTYE